MIISIDTGGTKTLIAAFDNEGNKTILDRFPTPQDTDEYIAQVATTIQAKVTDHIDIIVAAVPGVVKDGTVLWCGNLGWRNFAYVEALQPHFKDVPIHVENDANLGGLGEARSLEKTPLSCLYITISTGIGSGVITNGRIDPGLRMSEAGHALVEYDGVVQEWEHFASGSAIVKVYNKLASEIHSERQWRHIVDRFSRGFLAVIPIIQPEIIIIGGSVGEHFKKYGVLLTEMLKERLPEQIPCPTIVQAKHPDEAVIYGCYYYALDTLANS